MQKPVLEPERRTNPLIWCAALICTILTIAVIITGFAVFVGYLVLRPKVPQMSVRSARLESIDYDMAGILAVKVSVVITAQNDNARAHASFYKTSYALSFGGVKVAYLNAEPFDVPKNSSRDLYYLVESTPIPLSPEQGETVEAALRRSQVAFDLKGTSRTRWRIWRLGSVKFWLHLDCHLKLPLDRTTLYPKCTTKSR
ncbi:PREDICTED: NDR1/HIN1-like protein 12 [Ipomoea nil]|uniref:NDR1/HIN1-like protein 12 n=1 Tax=Ipomoea nil TaxID=35883 RepID=UPI000901DF62|nr:PREDICTED: NDR1/HIN1-like protein 12 [Ipomoea nil]